MTARGNPPRPRSPALLPGERGVGIMEVVVATVMATVAILALAYSFATGREMIVNYEYARMALGAAQSRMDWLAAEPSSSTYLSLGSHGGTPVVVDGATVAQESWTVEAYDDPTNGTPPGQVDLKKVTVTVAWGRGTPAQTIRLTRLLSPY